MEESSLVALLELGEELEGLEKTLITNAQGREGVANLVHGQSGQIVIDEIHLIFTVGSPVHDVQVKSQSKWSVNSGFIKVLNNKGAT